VDSISSEVTIMPVCYDPTLDPIGYADCVLESLDDYEPYGYARLGLQETHMGLPERTSAFDRVIEAQLLADRGLVG
jgi:hypothetical protein